MKNIFRNTFARVAGIVLAAASALSLGACTQSDVDEPVTPLGGNGNEQEVTLVVSVPGAQTPSTPATRTIDGVKEAEVKTLNVLVFDASVSPETLTEHVVADVVSQSTSAGDQYEVQFRAKLTIANNRRIVVVANAAPQVTAAVATAGGVGASKRTVLENLTFANTAKWKADGTTPTGYTPIPMYGETGVENITSGKKFTNIALTRMLARIDVQNSAATFTMSEIHLCNYFTKGDVAPEWDTNGDMVTPTGKANIATGITVADKRKGAANAMAYTSVAANYAGEIYTFESWEAGNAADSDLKDATCLVVKGTYNGNPYYYRVDFTKYENPSTPGFDPSKVKFMPLLRNHKYAVVISACEGPGYSTLQEALNATSVLSNLKTTIISYDEGKIKYVVHNGQYMLGFSEKEYSLPSEAGELTMNVFTDNPTGWSATIPAHAGSWLSFVGGVTTVTGAAGNHNATLSIKYTAATAPRQASIAFKAGRLTYNMNISQLSSGAMELSITDVNGTEIDLLNFDYHVGAATVPSQRFFVTWKPASLNCVVSETLGSPVFTYAAGSDDPVTMGPLAGGVKMFTVNPTVASVADESAVVRKTRSLNFSLTDSFGNTITKGLTLAQANKLIPDVGIYFMNGSTYNVTVRANVEWKVELRSDANSVLSTAFATQTGGIEGVGTSDTFSFTLVDDSPTMSKPNPSFVEVVFYQKMNGVWVPYKDGGATHKVYQLECINKLRGGSNCYMVDGTNPIEIPLSQVGISMGYNHLPRQADKGNGFLGMNWFLPSECADMKVAVLWSDVNLFGSSNSVVHSVSYDGGWIVYGKITVIPGTAIGNALVIFYKDVDGNGKYDDGTADQIKWSWHIWNAGIYPYSAPGIPNTGWLDRNLGATTNTEAQVSSLGFHYQWGRKDPHLGPGAVVTDITTPPTIHQTRYFNMAEVTGMTNSTSTSLGSFTGGTFPVGTSCNLDMATMHPNYSYRRIVYKDWYADDGSTEDDLWGGLGTSDYLFETNGTLLKSVYDPCPVGYRVINKTKLFPINLWSGSGIYVGQAGWSATWNHGLSNSSYGGYYPAAGYTSYSSMFLVGKLGSYWLDSYTPFAPSFSTVHNVAFEDVATGVGNCRRDEGASVRCVAE